MNRFRVRLSIRHDEMAGFWPGTAFAGGLAVVGGGTIMALFGFWAWLASRSGADLTPGGGLIPAVAWWGSLWLLLSAGLLAGLWCACRAWRALYPVYRRREAARARRDAVASAAAVLAEHRAVTAPDEE